MQRKRVAAVSVAQPYCNRGVVKDSQGDHDGAIADFSKAIELDAEFAAEIDPSVREGRD